MFLVSLGGLRPFSNSFGVRKTTRRFLHLYVALSHNPRRVTAERHIEDFCFLLPRRPGSKRPLVGTKRGCHHWVCLPPRIFTKEQDQYALKRRRPLPWVPPPPYHTVKEGKVG